MRNPSSRVFWFSQILLLLCLVLLEISLACGSGAGGGSSSHGLPDFSLAVSPANQTITASNQVSVAVSEDVVHGFSSGVNVTVSGIPPGITASPGSFTLFPGTQQQVTFTARPGVVSLQGTVIFTGAAQSGSFIHTAKLPLAVNGISSDAPLRTRYRRTDATTEYFLWLNQHWMLYHAPTGRYFVADSSSNRIQIIDPISQNMVATIPLPGAFGMDDTPDHRTIWVGTQIGDVYSVDPFSMAVTHRYIGSEIGTNGYLTSSVQVLADGRLALIGIYGGVGGTDSIAVWNPADNSRTIYGRDHGYGPLPCDFMTNFTGFTRSVDRAHILIATGGEICELDPSTGTYIVGAGWASDKMTLTPDGRYIIVPSYPTSVTVIDAHTLATVSQFTTMGDTSSGAGLAVSADSRTLYVSSDHIIYAHDIPSGQLVGWTSNVFVPQLAGGTTFSPPHNPYLLATDGTGVFAGPLEEGIGFVDLSVLNTGSIGTQLANSYFSYLSPATGRASGGTSTQWPTYQRTLDVNSVYFGLEQASEVSSDVNFIHATSSANLPGPADVYTFLTEGSTQILPEAFSYGPTILQVTPNMATAEGGGIGYIYGYGFGPTSSNTIPSDLTVTVAGTPVHVTTFSGNAYNDPYTPFQLENVSFTIPPGTNGSAVDVSVTTSAGTATAPRALAYMGAVQQFSSPGAALAQGIYDPHRDLYYFTDATQIRVFSRIQRQWLTPIPITPPPGTTENLWGIALSPDGSKLAVSDATAGAIYVLDPTNPTNVQTFIVGSNYPFLTNPCGIAISDAGNVYYWVYVLGQGGGADQFFRLDTNTGAIHNYEVDGPGLGISDLYLRDVISSDNSHVYLGLYGLAVSLDTATDQFYSAPDGPGCCYGNYELALSADQSHVTATDFIYDLSLNGESYYSLNDRERLNISAVYGAKLSPDSRLLFQPWSNGIDVLDGRLGNLRTRISVPVALSPNYDALVTDTTDNVLIAITGEQGDGIAIVDLSSLPEPPALPYVGEAHSLSIPATWRLGLPLKRALHPPTQRPLFPRTASSFVGGTNRAPIRAPDGASQ